MKLRSYLSIFLILVFILNFCYAAEINTSVEEDSNSSSDSEVIVDDNGNTTITINNYYNYYYINYNNNKNVSLYSMNNLDESAYWRPKYQDIKVALKEYIEFENNTVNVDLNAFDVNYSDIDKSRLPTSRALETLGYDYLLFEEIVESNGEISRTIGYNNFITAPYFIMNIYKALGLDLYDIYYMFGEDDECGAYVTRTNPKSYWEKFLNDHPIDYNVYNDASIDNVYSGKVLSVADAIVILKQMLEFYGEPSISKQEEYMLLQVYGEDVPIGLSDLQKEAWSYLKCRGIIGEDELEYSESLNFDIMADLLMRVKDKDSRTNFKDIKITTTLDSVFIDNGYYDTTASIVSSPEVLPEDVSVNWSVSDRIDFLIEITNDIAFKYKDTGELNRNIFISYGPNYNSSAIPGSVFEGIVDGKYYYFSIPRSQISGGTIYVNSKSDGDMPLNYMINDSVGGVYSKFIESDGSIVYDSPDSFDDVMPESFYTDMSRINGKSYGNAFAAGSGTLTTYFDTSLLDVDKSIEVIKKIGGNAQLVENDSRIKVTIESSKVVDLGGTGTAYDLSRYVGRRLVISEEHLSKSSPTNVILGLTGDGLLVPIDKLMDIGVVSNYTSIIDEKESILIIYMNDKDIVRVDDKKKTIQRGNSYIQLNNETPLFRYKGGRDNTYTFEVDFRAIYGAAGSGFDVNKDGSNDSEVVIYSNSINSFNSPKGGNSVSIDRVGEYYYYDTTVYLPYVGSSTHYLLNSEVPLLFKYKDSKNVEKSSKDTISEVLLPLSSPNAFGNYIMYSEWNPAMSIVDSYLVVIKPKGVSNVVSNKAYDEMFNYVPGKDFISNYDVNVYQVNMTSNNYNIVDVPGAGYCYRMKILNNNDDDKLSFMSSYLKGSDSLPFAVCFSGNTPRLLSFNLNFYGGSTYSKLTIPSGSVNKAIPAPISVQSWFSNPITVSSVSTETARSYINNGISVYWGSSSVSVNDSGKFIASPGNLNLTYLEDSMSVFGISKSRDKATYSESGKSLYKNPKMYSMVSGSIATVLSDNKDTADSTDLSKKLTRLQEFFDQFDEITFMDFIKGLDNTMSIIYYLITRVIPIIILCLLTLMLLISFVSDIRIVQLFCDKVVDPVKILTFGNHNIYTVNNRFLIISLIIALTLMGIIQAGNLEKIIMFFIKTFYAIVGLFN